MLFYGIRALINTRITATSDLEIRGGAGKHCGLVVVVDLFLNKSRITKNLQSSEILAKINFHNRYIRFGGQLCTKGKILP